MQKQVDNPDVSLSNQQYPKKVQNTTQMASKKVTKCWYVKEQQPEEKQEKNRSDDLVFLGQPVAWDPQSDQEEDQITPLRWYNIFPFH